MSNIRRFSFRSLALFSMTAGVALATVAGGGSDANAQGSRYASYSCGALWHARNSIYARQGYCFETQRAIATFGRACFRPFGRLTAGQQARVDEIKHWENRKGCND